MRPLLLLPLLVAAAAEEPCEGKKKQLNRIWERKRQRWENNVKIRRETAEKLGRMQRAANPNGFDTWEPEWECDIEDRVGGRSGDGPKWMCGVALLPSKPVVYSVGSNGDTQFEESMHALRPKLDMHTFDPTIGAFWGQKYVEKTERTLSTLNNAKFHAWGLGNGSKIELKSPGRGNQLRHMGMIEHSFVGRTIDSIIKELGHTHIDVLKVDIEGAEYSSLQSLWKACETRDFYVGQLLVEMHVHLGGITMGDLVSFFEGADKCGLMLFHKERNGWGCMGWQCVEFSFVHRKYAYRTLAWFL